MNVLNVKFSVYLCALSKFFAGHSVPFTGLCFESSTLVSSGSSQMLSILARYALVSRTLQERFNGLACMTIGSNRSVVLLSSLQVCLLVNFN